MFLYLEEGWSERAKATRSSSKMAKGGLFFDKLRRCVRTVYFMVAMLVSLLVSSLPVLVALGDVLVPCVLISSFTCVRCYGFEEHLHRYAFKSSLTDIPLVSIVRSLIITCKTPICIPFSLSSKLFIAFIFFISFSIIDIFLLSNLDCLIFSFNSQGKLIYLV